VFGRATITLGIGPHSIFSILFFYYFSNDTNGHTNEIQINVCMYYIIYNPALQGTEREGWGALVQNDYPPQELAVQSLPITVRPTRRHAVQI